MILILDFGSQYSELIARRIRELNVYSEVIPHDTTLAKIREKYPDIKGIILSGGPSSVFDADSPDCDAALLGSNIPILGICYGLQLICKKLGGEVIKGLTQEYGKAKLYIDDNLVDAKDRVFGWIWDERSFIRHKHVIKVVAYDNRGNSADDEIVVWKFF